MSSFFDWSKKKIALWAFFGTTRLGMQLRQLSYVWTDRGVFSISALAAELCSHTRKAPVRTNFRVYASKPLGHAHSSVLRRLDCANKQAPTTWPRLTRLKRDSPEMYHSLLYGLFSIGLSINRNLSNFNAPRGGITLWTWQDLH